MLKYSIIVPIYNVEKYLSDCVNSLIQQTYKNIEIILVDDGSPDNSPLICDNYAKLDSRIKVIHKKNGGLVSARKAGAESSTGDYICCVDGDDFIDLNYIQHMNDIIDNWDVDIVCCGYHLTTSKKTTDIRVNALEGYYDKEKIKKSIFPYLIMGDKGDYFLPTVWSKAIRRDIYIKNQIQVPDSISMGEDGACTIPCIIDANSMFISPECKYYYRYNNLSMTKGKRVLSWEGQIAISNHFKNALNASDYNFDNQMSRRMEKSFFNVAKTQFYSGKTYKEAKNEILKGYNLDVFRKAIDCAHFAGIKMKIVDYIIKHRLIFAYYVYSKL